MTKYLHNIDDEMYETLQEYKKADNKMVAKQLQQLANENRYVEFNTVLLHLGMLLQIVAASINIKQKELEEIIGDNSNSLQRKMDIIIKELNEKINLRYNFNEDTEILRYLYTYNNEGYVFIEKEMFVVLILQKTDDIVSLNKI